jgi:hypothetical protein
MAEGELGDADCSGELSTNDALYVLLEVAYGYETPCGVAGDMDCDGMRETVDALEILRRIAGFSALTGCA